MSSRPYASFAGFPHQKRTTQTTNDRDLTWSVLEGDDAILSNDGCMMAAWYDRNLWATHDGATGVNPSRIFETSRLPMSVLQWLTSLIQQISGSTTPWSAYDFTLTTHPEILTQSYFKTQCQEIRQRLPSAICQHHTRVALSSIPAFFLDGSSTALLPTYPEPMFYQHTKQESSIIHELLQFTDLYINQSRPPRI